MIINSLSSSDHTTNLTIFHIPWEDILFQKVIPLLSLKDLFNLRCCSKISKELVDMSFQNLEEICFSGNNTKNIHLAFKVLANNCIKLKILNLAKCLWLTDDLLIPLLKNNKNLKFVNLNECTSVSAIALQPIIIDCRELKVLKLSKCQWLTAGAVDAFTLHQCNLEEFDISYCYSIGERCLLIFFRKFDKLRILSLAYTPSVTDNVLKQIGSYCKSLQHINLVGCNNISDIGIE